MKIEFKKQIKRDFLKNLFFKGMPFKYLAGLHYPYPLINASLFSDSGMGILLLHTEKIKFFLV